MGTSDEIQQKLLGRIAARRSSIAAFINEQGKQGDRLTNLNIACTALTAVFTAGPGLGGTQFTQFVQQITGIDSSSAVWRSLCLLGMALSIVAAITGNLYKSRDLADRLAKAQTAATLLEGLATSLEFGTVSLEEATRQYQQYLTGIPFIPEKSSPAQPAGV